MCSSFRGNPVDLRLRGTSPAQTVAGRAGRVKVYVSTLSAATSATALRVRTESGPLRAVHLSRHKWPGGGSRLGFRTRQTLEPLAGHQGRSQGASPGESPSSKVEVGLLTRRPYSHGREAVRTECKPSPPQAIRSTVFGGLRQVKRPPPVEVGLHGVPRA